MCREGLTQLYEAQLLGVRNGFVSAVCIQLSINAPYVGANCVHRYVQMLGYFCT